MERVFIYEEIQKLHKENEFLHILIDLNFEYVFPEDLIDLPRLKLTIINAEPTREAQFTNYLEKTQQTSRVNWELKDNRFDIAILDINFEYCKSRIEPPETLISTTGKGVWDKFDKIIFKVSGFNTIKVCQSFE